MTKHLAAALIALALVSPGWTKGPETERELDRRIATLRERQDDTRDAIKRLKQRIERKRERIDKRREFIRILSVQDGWVASLTRLRYCESGNDYQESPSEGVPGHDGAYQYDTATWGNAYGYSHSYLAPWYLQDLLTALKLQNDEEWRWACW